MYTYIGMHVCMVCLIKKKKKKKLIEAYPQASKFRDC